MAWNYFPRYYSQPTVGQIKNRAENAARKAGEKGIKLHPITVRGRDIVKEWWGIAWCNNLEKYADYASRLSRGKKYVRSGAVIDLQIEEGVISALVSGSRGAPYKVKIKIDPLSEDVGDPGLRQVKLDYFPDILIGKFRVEEK